MDLLETQDVVKQYANHLALDGVSIQVPRWREHPSAGRTDLRSAGTERGGEDDAHPHYQSHHRA